MVLAQELAAGEGEQETKKEGVVPRRAADVVPFVFEQVVWFKNQVSY